MDSYTQPDEYTDYPTAKCVFAVALCRCLVQEITARQVGLGFGESPWAINFASMGFTPALSFYTPCGVGHLLQNAGDCPCAPSEYNPCRRSGDNLARAR